MIPVFRRRKEAVPRSGRFRSLVPIVLVCLVGSAALRLASGTGQALAQGVAGLIPAAATPQDVAPAPVGASAGQCPAESEIGTILARLTEREAALSGRQGELAAREVAMAAAEERLHRRIGELREAEQQLAATMSRTAGAAEADVVALVAVYASMKPKDAVPLFEAMAPHFAAGFLIRMRPDAAAAILAGLPPARAYAISAILAGRNAEVPVPVAAAAAE